jgi:hypothetical protein
MLKVREMCGLICVFVIDLRRPAAAQQTDLPSGERAAVAVASHEVRHRRGHDPQGPLRRLQPAGNYHLSNLDCKVRILN